MVVIGVDDTDSRSRGMCTTWIATEIARQLPPGSVAATLLVRLNPAVEHKTRGNGAVAIHTTAPQELAFDTAAAVVQQWAVHDDPNTNPGVVVASDETAQSPELRQFVETATRTTVDREALGDHAPIDRLTKQGWGNGRGLIGATAAVGAAGAYVSAGRPSIDWSYEWLVYREEDRWGTPRDVTVPTIRRNGDPAAVWDTVDPETGEVACVPHSPCPVLFGIRGDDPAAVRAVGEQIAGEPKERARLFVTNQGTDAHLLSATTDSLSDGHSYRVRGTVVDGPETREGGHVRLVIENGDCRLPCLAFAPTGRFRDHVRQLVRGDEVIVCGEVGRGSLKLEKFALVQPVLSHRVTPTCPDCDRRMKSAGRDQGYRCRECRTHRPGPVLAPLERDLEVGWYEVPPTARRHLAAPLVRGHYDLPVHPTSG